MLPQQEEGRARQSGQAITSASICTVFLLLTPGARAHMHTRTHIHTHTHTNRQDQSINSVKTAGYKLDWGGLGRFGEWEEGDRRLDVLLRPSQESHGPLTAPEMHTRTSKSGQMHNSEWAGPNNCSGLWAAEVVPSCQAAPWEDQDRGILLLGMCRSDRGGMALDWLVCLSETSPG